MCTKLIFFLLENSPQDEHYHLLAICPQLVDMNFFFRVVIGIWIHGDKKWKSMTKIRNLIKTDKDDGTFCLFSSCFPHDRKG